MDERNLLAEQFEEQRGQLRAVAYRMLGSLSEADDTVQNACDNAKIVEIEGIGDPERLAQPDLAIIDD